MLLSCHQASFFAKHGVTLREARWEVVLLLRRTVCDLFFKSKLGIIRYAEKFSLQRSVRATVCARHGREVIYRALITLP